MDEKGQPLNLLVRMPNMLGDLVMGLPALRYVREAFPDANLYVASRRPFLDLLAMQPDNGTLVEAPLTSKFAHMLPALWRGRADIPGLTGRLHAGILLSLSASTALWLWRLHPKIRIGYNTDNRRLLLSHAIPCGETELSLHYSRFMLKVAERAVAVVAERFHAPHEQVAVDAAFRLPRLEVSGKAVEEANALAGDAGLGREYVVFAPSAQGVLRNWPVEHYRRVAEELGREYSLPVAVTGTAGQMDICNAVAKGMANAVNLAGKTTSVSFAALVAGAKAYLGGDSGGAHVAAALGVPTVVIFAFSNPKVTLPAGKRVIQIGIGCERAGDSKRLSVRQAMKAVMEAIWPEEVVRALREILG